jgi:hypothetical protein
MYGAAFLILGLCLLAQAIVGDDVWNYRRSRKYSWPALAFAMGFFLWPAMFFPMRSPVDVLAHSAWAQTIMLAGAAELGLAQRKLRSRYWHLTIPFAFAVSGAATLAHERYGWLAGRSSFVHHLLGWTLLVGAFVSLGHVLRPRCVAFRTGLAFAVISVAVELFSTRDSSSIF